MSHSVPEDAGSQSRTATESHPAPGTMAGDTAAGGVSVDASYATTGEPSNQRSGSGSESGDSKAEAAKQQGQQVKDEALEGSKHVAGVASEQGQAVLTEAGDQAKDLMGHARSQLAGQAATQQENLTAWLRSLADELHQMVDRGSEHGSGAQPDSSGDEPSRGTASNGVATQAVSQAQGRVKDAADWLEQHEPGDLVDEATRFARRRPGAFLAVAAVGGLLVGRFTRGLKDDTSNEASPAHGGTRDATGSATDLGSSTGRAGQSPAGQPEDESGLAMGGRVVPAAQPQAGLAPGEPLGQEPR